MKFILIITYIFTALSLQAQNTQEIKKSTPVHQQYFGSHLFQGQFAKESFKGFNPEYVIAVGDKIAVKLWGAFDFEQIVTVDEQGNIFVPKVGPIKVVGVRNKDLNNIVQKSVRKVFFKNVGIYTNLSTSQSVKVYVTGFVSKPGLYTGLNSDSVLHYIDKAGGIDTERGSFIKINILRHQRKIQVINLYDFILKGTLPNFQFHDGDTILVEPKKNTSLVLGLIKNEGVFEFDRATINLSELLKLANRAPQATHVRISHNKDQHKTFEYLNLKQINDVKVYPDDRVEIVNDRLQGNLSIRIEGQHQSTKEYIVAPGTTLGDILKHVEYGPLSDRHHLQLFRKSVKVAQKKRLEESLQALEKSLLSASSSTQAEAELRAAETKMLLQVIEKAREIEPIGQVVLSKDTDFSHVVLEEHDIIKVPTKSNLVMIHGEVMFPNAIVFRPDFDIDDYITAAGGFTERARDDYILIMHLDGSFTVEEGRWFSKSETIIPGDEIFVLPKVDTKTFQLSKDISQILFNLAATAKVLLVI